MAELNTDPLKRAVTLIKSAKCYVHQSNEHPTWEKSRAREIVESIIDEEIRTLPGFADAPWGIS